MVATETELEQHRAALTGHCYRMLGSAMDADDAVQETMVRAWRARDGFDGRSSVRTWLYRIATNVCLDALSDRGRRERPVDGPGPYSIEDDLAERPRTHWLEPISDACALPSDGDPAERAMLRQSIRLAFVAALQHLPPKQRAALLYSDVLGFSAQETAAALDTSIASITSALQRARAALGERLPVVPGELSAAQQMLVERYVAAFERYDVDALAALLHEDAVLSMPPYTMWLRGRDTIRHWLLGRGIGCKGSRLVRVAACGAPAFAQYRQGGAEPWSLTLLDVDDAGVRSWTAFLDVQTWFPRFGLPLVLA
jgi:RNA polymerase sigma-70 factor (ECF subfamily)